MFYYTYKITNKINNKIYIGAHSTENMNDGYFGSGKLLKRAQAKYGIENFSKEILEFFDDKTSMFESEKNIVTEEFLKRPDVYNLKLGGEGGWDHLNTEEYLDKKKEALKRGKENFLIKYYSDPAMQEKYKEMGSRRFKELWTNPTQRTKFIEKIRETWTGKTHSAETINKMKETHAKNKHQQGENNSHFGTMWIHSLEEKVSKRIKKTDAIPEGWNKGRKIKFL